jgi:hypothetical protein
MKPRELGGAVTRASEVRVFVAYASHPEGGTYMSITGPQARFIVEDAKSKDIEDIDVTINARGDVFIGDEHTIEDDEEANEPGPVCSECGAEWADGHRCPT